MSTAVELAEKLPLDSNVRSWTPPQRAIMQQLGLIDRKGYSGKVLEDAPAGVIESFLTQCQRTHLDPMARQIYCIERGGKWGVQISIDGFRLIADRSKGYRGQTPAQWTADGREWLDVWLSDDPPAAARVGIYREGFDGPQYAVATFAGYCPRDRDGNLAPKNQWLTNPSNQLAKCAEMLGLRKTFPNELSGLYGTEEMDQATMAAKVPQSVPVVQPAPVLGPEVSLSRDWVTVIAETKTIDGLRELWEGAPSELNLIAAGSQLSVGKLIQDRKAKLEAEANSPVVVAESAPPEASEPAEDAAVVALRERAVAAAAERDAAKNQADETLPPREVDPETGEELI